MELMQLLWVAMCAFMMAGCFSAIVIVWGCVWLSAHNQSDCYKHEI